MSAELTPRNEGSAVALIREAIASKADPVYLRELLAVRDAWEAAEARKAFSLAVAEFQREAPIIAKDDQGEKSKYAKLDRIWRAIRPLMGKLGLSVTWQVCELRGQDLCHIEGKLGHKDGHSDRLVFDIPIPDVIRTREGKAVTNVAQQMGIAHTYAQRYATCSALGIITGKDDDADGLGAPKVTEVQAQELRELVDAARGVDGFNEKAFYGYAGTDDLGALPQARFEDLRKALKRKIGGGK